MGKILTLEDAGLIRNNLFPVFGELAERYNAALDSIIGKRTSLKSFRIDKRGESPEIEAELGRDYLQIGPANRYLIIVSPDQGKSPLIHPETTYDDEVIDAVYSRAGRTLLDITSREATFAQLDNSISVYTSLEDLLLLDQIKVQLDSPLGTVRKIAELKSMHEKLSEHLLDNEYINQMLSLVAQVGDVRARNVGSAEIRYEVGSFFTRFFDGVHVLKNMKEGRSSSSKTFVVHDQERLLEDDNGFVQYMRLKDPTLIERLQDFGLIQYDLGIARTRQSQIEDAVLLDQGCDLVEMTAAKRQQALFYHAQHMPQVWTELRDLAKYNPGKKDALRLILGYSKELRYALAVPHKEKPVMAVMLTKLYEHDWQALYKHNPRHLENLFSAMPEHKQKYVLQQLTIRR